jgi:hypothetical protein
MTEIRKFLNYVFVRIASIDFAKAARSRFYGFVLPENTEVFSLRV